MTRNLFFITAVGLLVSCNNEDSSQTITNSDIYMESVFKPLDWVHYTNIYEVNVRQYTREGTFNAFAKELPRLKDMGVHVLWFMPIYPIGVENRKGSLGSYYSIQDYTAVNAEYGTPADFKNLVEAAHAQGMKVIIDWVANHTSWDHVWTKSHPDFFSKDNNGKFRPPFPDWEDVIHLNFDNKDLREAMIGAMNFWIKEYNIDGFRCDMAHLVPLDFWREARQKLDAVKPLFWFAETEEINYHKVFDASNTWEFLHKMEAFWRKETDILGLDSILDKYHSVFPTTAFRIYFTSNHDENSHSKSEYIRLGDAARAFAVLCATWNGIPLVYSGQELPNKKSLKFFDKDPIEWTGKYELHDFYKTLLNLHFEHPALRVCDPNAATFRLKTSADQNIFAYLRKNDNREVLVVLNLSPELNRFDITDEHLTGKFKNAFSQVDNDFTSEKSFEMQPWEYLLYEK